MILGQLRIWARQTTYAALSTLMKNISLPAYAAIIIVVKYFEGSLHVVFQVAACPEGGLNVSAYRAFIEFCTNPEEALEFLW